MVRTYTLTLKTLKLRPGQYIIKPDGSTIGRFKVCGEIIHATINHPELCRIYDCIHCPYRDQNPCPGEKARGFYSFKRPLTA